VRQMEIFGFALGALKAQRTRALLSAFGIAIGIAAVVLLTSLGEGMHRFVISEFTQFGTNLIGVSPGKTKTAGASVGVFGTIRPLTIDDAIAIHQLPYIQVADPIVQGNAEIGAAGRRRRCTVYGVGGGFPEALQMAVASGRFLPKEDPHASRPLAVLGSRVRKEIFSNENPLGKRIEIAGYRYTITGVMAPKGQIFGIDLDDVVYIPVASAMELFDRESLMEIHVTYRPEVPSEQVEASIRQLLIARHGREDITVTSQKESLAALNSILSMLTFAVAALGGISVLVGAVGILTITSIGVRERTSEIGLLNALGATRRQISGFFLCEAILIAAGGGLGGIALGLGLARLISLLAASIPMHTAWMYVAIAEIVSVAIGLGAALLPARAAATLDPIEALRAE
jgi:putative ABC transport system permease protein